MPYKQHFRPQPEEIFESDLRKEDIVILVIGVIAVLIVFGGLVDPSIDFRWLT